MNYNLNRRSSKNTYKGETYEKAKKINISAISVLLSLLLSDPVSADSPGRLSYTNRTGQSQCQVTPYL
jgi:hypothetical protein